MQQRPGEEHQSWPPSSTCSGIKVPYCFIKVIDYNTFFLSLSLTHTHTHNHTHKDTSPHTNTHTHTHTQKSTHTHTHTKPRLYTCMHTFKAQTRHTNKQVNMHFCADSCTLKQQIGLTALHFNNTVYMSLIFVLTAVIFTQVRFKHRKTHTHTPTQSHDTHISMM